MPDAIIAELWRIKDAMAREHGYDVKALAAYLRGKEQSRRSSQASTLGSGFVCISSETTLVSRTIMVEASIKLQRVTHRLTGRNVQVHAA